MFKKATLAAVVCMAIVLVVVPTSAPAAWTDNTANLAEHKTVTAEGTWKTTEPLIETSLSNGTECTEFFISMTLEPGTTGKVNVFAPTSPSFPPLKCHGVDDFKGWCSPSSYLVTELPLPMHIESFGKEITLPNLHTVTTYSGPFCPFHELRFKGQATLTPDNPHAMTKITVSGSTAVYNATTGAYLTTGTISSSLNVTPSGTFGIT